MTPQTITFCLQDPDYVCPENQISNPPRIEIMRISKDGFFFKGEKVDDVHNVYERFNEWLKMTELLAN
jgi:hypothetical protein